MLYVYMKSKTPIVVETNLAYAIPYWEERKRLNPDIRIEHLEEHPIRSTYYAIR